MPNQENKQWDGVERRTKSRDDFVKAVVCAIREEALIGGIDVEAHIEQHKFIEEWIAEIKIKRERREKIKTQVMGWGIITALGSIGTGVYHSIIYLRDHLK